MQLPVQKRAAIPTPLHREHIFRAFCVGFPPAGLLTHAPPPPPCLRLSAGPPHLSHWEKLGAKARAPGGWKGLPAIPAPTSCSEQVRSELAALSKSLARLSFETTPIPWAPLAVFGHPHSETLCQVGISSVPICARCLDIPLL